MRGVERDEKKEVVYLLKTGVAPSVIAKEQNIPLSTVTSWFKEVKKDTQPNQSRVKYETDINAALQKSEANIALAISNVAADDISDKDWFKLQSIIHKELHNVMDITVARLKTR